MQDDGDDDSDSYHSHSRVPDNVIDDSVYDDQCVGYNLRNYQDNL